MRIVRAGGGRIRGRAVIPAIACAGKSEQSGDACRREIRHDGVVIFEVVRPAPFPVRLNVDPYQPLTHKAKRLRELREFARAKISRRHVKLYAERITQATARAGSEEEA